VEKIRHEVQRHWVHTPCNAEANDSGSAGCIERSTGVRAAVSSHIASSGMKRRSSQKSSGKPSAGCDRKAGMAKRTNIAV
jgi:hypothetical protein